MINIGAVKRAHARLELQTNLVMMRAADAAGRFAVEHVASFSNFKRRSPVGDSLKDTTTYRVMRTPGGRVIRVLVRATKPYAGFVEFDTKPHEIVARRKRFLRFTVGGRTVFARRVRHPGTKGFRFLYNATHAASRIFAQQVQADLARVAARF